MDFNQSNLEMENEEVMSEEYLDEIETLVLEGIYSIEDKVQDDLDLIALVEGNPRFYVKGKAGYRNVHEKDMAWVSIDKALKHPISGELIIYDQKQSTDGHVMKSLWSCKARNILSLIEQQGRSGSGKDNVSYEDLLTPQSMAIHRFMAHLYIPRKTVSNYSKSTLSTSFTSSKSRLPTRPRSKSSFIKPRLSISESEESTTSSLKDSPVASSTWNKNLVSNISESKW
ncbi:hypothetical protein ALC62_06590 [Cyphomyrmex costatus]|uniref:MADF domain-containing protein n=1 Tax=Cyphomyrmex costatus TaxID=456900 RepID=A0A151IIW5_9HYME|nr:hypothetical protein ALC62_06590 [Cyphomyrmex costatus]